MSTMDVCSYPCSRKSSHDASAIVSRDDALGLPARGSVDMMPTLGPGPAREALPLPFIGDAPCSGAFSLGHHHDQPVIVIAVLGEDPHARVAEPPRERAELARHILCESHAD